MNYDIDELGQEIDAITTQAHPAGFAPYTLSAKLLFQRFFALELGTQEYYIILSIILAELQARFQQTPQTLIEADRRAQAFAGFVRECKDVATYYAGAIMAFEKLPEKRRQEYIAHAIDTLNAADAQLPEDAPEGDETPGK
jgi:hypothetical protein